MDEPRRDQPETRSGEDAPGKPDQDVTVRDFVRILAVGVARVLRGRQAA